MTQTPPNKIQPKRASFTTPYLILWAAFGAGVINLLIFALPARLASNYNWTEDYGITEWLINYQSGFIRRGAMGEVLHFLWKFTATNPIHLSVFLSLFLYACLLTYFAVAAKRHGIASWLLFSSILIGHPIFAGNIVRKDILLLVFLVFMARAGAKANNTGIRALFLNALLCLGIIVHEMFFFIGLPCAVWLQTGGSGVRLNSVPLFRLRALLPLAPTFILFILIAFKISSRSDSSALAIHYSWSALWGDPLHPFPLEPGGSIMWIGANSLNTLKMVLGKHIHLYFGIPSAIWLLIVGFSSAAIACAGMSNRLSALFSKWLVVQTLSISPLFIIAVDSGRWLFLIFASSLVMAIEELKSSDKSSLSRIRIVNNISAFMLRIRDWELSLSSWVLPTLLLFWGITVPEWSPLGSLTSAPVWQFWTLGRNLHIIPSLGWLLHG